MCDFNNDFNNDFLIKSPMTKQEIQSVVSTFRAGQGNQVDQGGALARVLEHLIAAAIPAEVEDITALTDEQLDALNVGDKIAKVTGTARHLYVVTYKDAQNGGLCLTYADADNVETVSYDHTESGWAYNSTDKTHIGA